MILGLCLFFVSVAILIHVYIWILESFLWDTPRGMKTFKMDSQKAKITKEMAVNQGLYNLMLAIVAFTGVVLLSLNNIVAGASLIFAGAGSMATAGVFLFVTSNDKKKPAMIQLTPPLLGVVFLLVFLLM